MKQSLKTSLSKTSIVDMCKYMDPHRNTITYNVVQYFSTYISLAKYNNYSLFD